MFTQRPNPLTTSILSGDIDNNQVNRLADSFHVVRIVDAGEHWIDGFTIEYGAAIPASGNPTPGDPNNWGGGMLAAPVGTVDTTVEIRDVTFQNCIAGGGGGLAATDVDHLRISRCNFQNNIGFSRNAEIDIGYLGAGGAALFWNMGGTRLLGIQGGEQNPQQVFEGVYVYHSNFENNVATYGGAVCTVGVRENVWFVNNRFHDNAAYGGGGLFDYHGNTSSPAGWPRIEFCTFAANRADDNLGTGLWSGGGAIHTQWTSGNPVNPSIVLQSSVLWGNSDASPSTNGAESIGGAGAVTAQVQTSDVQVTTTPAPWPGPGSNGNINLDPLFVNLAGGNLRLTLYSPCIDAADDTVLDRTIGLGDFLDVDRNGIFGGSNGQHLPVDLDITPAREAPALTTPPPTPAVTNLRGDMGCYEYFLGNPGAN